MPATPSTQPKTKVTTTITLTKKTATATQTTKKTASYLGNTQLSYKIANFIRDEITQYYKHGILEGIIIRTQEQVTSSFNGVFRLLNEFFAEKVKDIFLPWGLIQKGNSGKTKSGIYTGSLVTAIVPDLLRDLTNTSYAGSIIETRMKSDLSIKGIMTVKLDPTVLRREQSNIMAPGMKRTIYTKDPTGTYAKEYLEYFKATRIQSEIPNIVKETQQWLRRFAIEATKNPNTDITSLNLSPTVIALKQAINKLRADIKRKINQAALNRIAIQKANTKAKAKQAKLLAIKKSLPPAVATDLEVQDQLDQLKQAQTMVGIPNDFEQEALLAGWSTQEIATAKAEGNALAQELGTDLDFDIFSPDLWRLPDVYIQQFQDKGFPSTKLLTDINYIDLEDRAAILADPDVQWTQGFQNWLKHIFDPLTMATRQGIISKRIGNKIAVAKQIYIDQKRGIQDHMEPATYPTMTWQDIQRWYSNVGLPIPESEARLIRLAVQSYTRGGDSPMRSLYYAWEAYLQDPRKGFDLKTDRIHDHPDGLDHTQQNLNLLKQYGRAMEFLRVAPHMPDHNTSNNQNYNFATPAGLPYTFYRGIGINNPPKSDFDKRVQSLSTGDTFNPGPLASWSTDIEIARTFSGMYGNKRVLFVIDAKPFIQQIPDVTSVLGTSAFPEEEEVFIGYRNFKVSNTDDITIGSTNYHLIYIEAKK